MARIYGSLIEAYKGHYEDDRQIRQYYQDWLKAEMQNGHSDALSFEGWFEGWVEEAIRTATPKERLAIYLEWNGILGWTEMIWSISQGEFEG